VYWNIIFIENSNEFFFLRCTIKASACKITQAKTKGNSAMHTNLPWMQNRRYFEQRIQVTSPFLFQVNFSYFLLEVCFQLLSVTSRIIPFQFVQVFEPPHMRNYSEIIWRVSFKQQPQYWNPTPPMVAYACHSKTNDCFSIFLYFLAFLSIVYRLLFVLFIYFFKEGFNFFLFVF